MKYPESLCDGDRSLLVLSIKYLLAIFALSNSFCKLLSKIMGAERQRQISFFELKKVYDIVQFMVAQANKLKI